MAKGFDFIQEDERLVHGNHEVDGYEIYYRRVPEHVSRAIIKRNTKFHRKRGEIVDWGKIGEEILEYMITGWKGGHHRVDGVRQELAYSLENIAGIPGDITSDLIDLSGVRALDDQEEDRKNSGPTSDSSTSTKV